MHESQPRKRCAGLPPVHPDDLVTGTTNFPPR